MFSPVIECPKCAGRCFRPFMGPFWVECRSCKGTGHQIRRAARIWWRFRYGSSRED
jgi:hypothetical protein